MNKWMNEWMEWNGMKWNEMKWNEWNRQNVQKKRGEEKKGKETKREEEGKVKKRKRRKQSDWVSGESLRKRVRESEGERQGEREIDEIGTRGTSSRVSRGLNNQCQADLFHTRRIPSCTPTHTYTHIHTHQHFCHATILSSLHSPSLRFIQDKTPTPLELTCWY